MRESAVLIVILTCAALVSPVVAEIVVLDDGTSVAGTVVGMTEAQVDIRTDYGTMSIDKTRISVIRFGADGPTAEEQAARAKKEAEEQQAAAAKRMREDGERDGRAEGYDKGFADGKRQEKGSRMGSAWGGCLLLAAIVGVVVLIRGGTLQ